MKIAIAFTLILFSSVAMSSTEPTTASATCPDSQLGETAEDCPWAQIARLFQSASETGTPISAAQLKELAPQVEQQLSMDSRTKNLASLWGRSINYDEYAKGIIVQPELLDALAIAFQLPKNLQREDRWVHAGMEHTYGYLFSLLRTPFGYKRARWVKADIETGFGLTRGTLGPNPKEGTLLSNVTAFLGRIAFLKDKKATALLADVNNKAAFKVSHFDTSKLKITRLSEMVTINTETVTLHTDFVPFTEKVEGSKNTALLIYSIRDSRLPHTQLITAFPIEASFMTNALNPENLGKEKTIVTRYNAYVKDLTAVTPALIGTRTVEELQ